MSKFFEFEPDSAFPLAEHSVGSIVNLIRVLGARKELARSHRLEIARDDKAMNEYLENMHLLRLELGHYAADDQGYDLGAIFGFELLKEQFQRRNLTLGQVDPSALRTYFNELLIDNQDAITTPTHKLLVESQSYTLKDAVTPIGFLGLQKIGITDNKDAVLTSRITFRDKSREKIYSMWENEKPLKEGIPTLQNALGTAYLGFTYGLADFYWPHQIEQTIGPYAEVLDSQNF